MPVSNPKYHYVNNSVHHRLNSMDKPRLNLNDLVPPWERELLHTLDKSVLKGNIRSDMDIFSSSSAQELVGEPSSFTQDAFSSLVIRQRYMWCGLV